jgi:hypothetical protein
VSDDEFLTQFEAGTLPKAEFSHRQHVRLAWLYLGRHEFADASARVVEGIKVFAALHGVTGLYHETITRAWLRLIADGRKRTPDAPTFAGFMEANPALATKGALHPYYDPETLKTDDARARFVLPDRAPLP